MTFSKVACLVFIFVAALFQAVWLEIVKNHDWARTEGVTYETRIIQVNWIKCLDLYHPLNEMFFITKENVGWLCRTKAKNIQLETLFIQKKKWPSLEFQLPNQRLNMSQKVLKNNPHDKWRSIAKSKLKPN